LIGPERADNLRLIYGSNGNRSRGNCGNGNRSNRDYDTGDF